MTAKAADIARRIGERIARRRDDVFLTREFRDLGGEDQVLRALRGLVRDGAARAPRLRRLWPRRKLPPLRRADAGGAGRFHRRGAAGARQARRRNGSRRSFSAPTTKAARPRCRSIPPCA